MTIKDVADYCGVSVSTVSRVLNNHPDVREEVRVQVMEAVKTLHYVPNAAARDLVKTTNDSIGLVVRGAENPFYTPIIRAIEKAVEAAGYELVFHQITTEDDELDVAAQLTRSKRLNGLILLGGRFNYTKEEVKLIDIPFVCCTFANNFGTIDATDFSSVSIVDRAEAYRAVRHLIKQGHRKIAVLTSSTNDRSISELRYNGYLDALKDAGIEPDEGLVMQCGRFDMGSAYEITRQLSRERQDFTALFAISDTMAIAAMKALHDEGRRVPEDCSVIAIDGIDMSLYTIPTLTTLTQPKEELGTRSVSILTDILSGKGGHMHERLGTVLREGGTVCPVQDFTS